MTIATTTATTGNVTAGQSARLRDHEFSDLYLGAAKIPVVRGFRGGGASQEVMDLPDPLHEDAMNLFDATHDARRAAGGANEIRLVYDGIPYRAALIGNPLASPPHAGLQLAGFQSEETDFDRTAPFRTDTPQPGEDWCLRRLPHILPRLRDLRLPSALTVDAATLARQSGLLLVSGPFSSGKSWTAGAITGHWLEHNGDVAVTFEDPIEMPLAGRYGSGGVCYQVEMSEEDFAAGIKAARRWAPRYVYMGEIRGAAAAAELLQISIGGPMVITTIHADSPVSALISLTKWAAEAMGERLACQLLANSLKMVATQRLERGLPRMDWLLVDGPQSFAIRHKIRNGNIAHLEDDLESQKRRRASGRNGTAR